MCFMTVATKTSIIQKTRNKLFQYFGLAEPSTNSESVSHSEEIQPTLEEFPLKNKMSLKSHSRVTQTLSSSEEGEWSKVKEDSYVMQKVQNLVRVFQARAEKVKERITQPPTPSPTPPPVDSTDSGESPKGNRPRLESLIRQEDFDEAKKLHDEEYVRLRCCKFPKSCIPTFPVVLDPQSKVYITWLFIVMLSYVYNAWVIVLRAVFPYQTAGNFHVFLAFDYIADLIYVIDIALFKVRLQFLHDGFWVDDPEKTRQNYFRKTMFKMDVLSLLPLDLLYFIYGANPLFRIPRLLKTQTFWEFFHRVDAVAKTPYVIRIIRTLLYMMYLIHLNACAYYAMSTWEGIGTNGWVFQGEGNAYIRCFYFATKTATSIGKNPKPENEYEYVFMTVSWLMGVFIFAFLIGQIRDIVATATQSKTQYRQLMDQTVMYMRNLNLPDDLHRRVRLWLNHTWEQQKTINESGILDSLPRKMKTDVAINVHYNTLVKVQLFKDCDKALLRDLVLQLKPVLFLPGDYICRKGEVGKEMYIVNKGLVQVTDGENGEIVLATLSEGSVFGEISLLGISGCSRRTADVRSQGFSNLFVLSKDDLWEALKNYPEAQKVLRKKAKMLIRENEARDKASKNNNIAETVKPIIRHDTKRPRTPLLIKTVIQVVPKDSKCAQMLVGPTTRINLTEELLAEDKSPKRSLIKPAENKQTSSTKGKDQIIGNILFSPQVPKKKVESKPRSLSTTEISLPNSTELLEMETLLNIPKNEPQRKTDLVSETIAEDKTAEESKIILKTIRSLLPKDAYRKRLNTVHPKENLAVSDNRQKPNLVNNSEDSGISVDMKMHARMLSAQKSDDSAADSESSCEMSAVSSRKIIEENILDQVLKEDTKETGWISPSPSVFSLRSLFRTSSSKSCGAVIKDKHSTQADDVPPDALHRSGSITSSSTSTGYENLAFVPVDILSSRRSSMFSDTSC